MEKKAKKREDVKQEKGEGMLQNRLRKLSTEGIWSQEKVRGLEGEGWYKHAVTGAAKVQGWLQKRLQVTGVNLNMGTSDTKIVYEPFFFGLSRYGISFQFPIFTFPFPSIAVLISDGLCSSCFYVKINKETKGENNFHFPLHFDSPGR